MSRVTREDVKSAFCRYCGAKPGQPCTSKGRDGVTRVVPWWDAHAIRKFAAGCLKIARDE